MRNKSKKSTGVLTFAVVLPVLLCVVLAVAIYGASHRDTDVEVDPPINQELSTDLPIQQDNQQDNVQVPTNVENQADDNKPKHNDNATLPDTRPNTPPPVPNGDDGVRLNVNLSDWNLILVNPTTYLPEGFSVELAKYNDSHSVDARIVDALKEMVSAMKAQGLSPVICSSYRTQQKQQSLFDNQVNRLKNKGMSDEQARAQAGTVVAIPGTSEHQTGLAVDIVALSYQILDEKQEETAEQQWLMEHCHEYGFILRYPSNKSEVTGIIYEPWHYRYVGKEVAQDMKNKDICFEEWLELYR